MIKTRFPIKLTVTISSFLLTVLASFLFLTSSNTVSASDAEKTSRDKTNLARGSAVPLACTDFALLVSNYWAQTVERFDGNTGTWEETLVSGIPSNANFILQDPIPNGSLHISSSSGSIYKYDAFTGAEDGTQPFISNGAPNNLNFTEQMRIGLDGNLYVTSQGNNTVKRFNATTGTLIDTFISAPAHGLEQDSSGDWYLSDSIDGGTIDIYNSSGIFQSTLYTYTTGEIPRGLVLDSSGDLYAVVKTGGIGTGAGNGARIDKFDLPSGARSTFATLDANSSPFAGIAWGPDNKLYIADFRENEVHIYDTAGTLLQTIPETDNLSGPHGIAFTTCSEVTEFDYGDLPDDDASAGDDSPNSPGYHTNITGTIGASHIITSVLQIGATIDSESDGQPSSDATGDGSDEDGVRLPTFTVGQSANVTVAVTNTTGAAAYLYGFIDFNGNGVLSDTGEVISQTVNSSQNVTLSFTVPANADSSQQVGARFRLSSDADLGPNGAASDGEVEDYLIQVQAAATCPNEVFSFDWDQINWQDPPDSGSYPWVQTFTNLGGSGVDVTVTIPREHRDGNQEYIEQPGDDMDVYTGDADVLRFWHPNDTQIDQVVVSFSEPILGKQLVYGGNRLGGGAHGTLELTAYDGANVTGNTVIPNANIYPDPSTVYTITRGTALSNPANAALTITDFTGTAGADLNGAYVASRQSYVIVGLTPDRNWGIIDYQDVTMQSFSWELYGSSVTDPLTARDNVQAGLANSAYLGRFLFSKSDQTCTTGAIGNYVWLDENSDGYQDAGEAGIPNVIVNLTDSSGTVYTTTTDAQGGYLFPGLASDSYTVTIPASNSATGGALENLTQSTAQPIPAGSDFGNQTSPYLITLGEGEENLTADFGYNWNPSDDVNNPTGSPNAALGDRIWVDSDGDGAQDPNEVGVSGVEVTIYYDPDGNGVYDTPYTVGGYSSTTTTDDNGNYIFDDLPAGAYVVTVTDDASASHDVLNTGNYSQTGDPDHFGTTGVTNDNSTTTPVVLAPGDVFLNADFGYQPTAASLGSIGNTVWFDADADGVGPSTVNGDAGGNGDPAQTGGADDSEYGIAGVTVALIKDSDGDGVWDVGEPIIATDITDANGQYLFSDLPITDGAGSDDYLVWVNDSESVLASLSPTYDADGLNNPTSGEVTGPHISAVQDLSATAVTDQDFGYTPIGQTWALGAIGDTIWFDSDNSGGNAQDAGEAGIEGVLVNLTLEDGSVITTTTDENGHYYFGGLTLDEPYTVTVDTSNFSAGGILEGMGNTYDPSGLNTSTGQAVTLTSGSPINLSQDFSYYATANGSIGNLVWLDLDADGVYDGAGAGETPIGGVTIDLYRDLDGDGELDAGEPLFSSTVTTDTINVASYGTDGTYLFSGLPAGAYIVDVTDKDGVLAGYWHSLGTASSDNNSQIDPYAVTISAGEQDLTADFGYYVLPAAVGNYVWLDSNGDGIQDSSENGIPNVVVTLVISYTDGTNTTVSTLTDANGHYSFGNLLLDEDYASGSGTTTPLNGPPAQPAYTISVNTSQAALSAYSATTVNVNSNDLEDSDNHSGVAAQPTQGQTDVSAQSPVTNEAVIASYDFGFMGEAFGAIGNYVWLDENSDGYQDAGEAGIPGVIVNLTNSSGTVYTTTTDAQGGYLFADLAADSYTVTISALNTASGGTLENLTQSTAQPIPAGNDFGNQTSPYVITLGSGEENLTADFGYNWNPSDDVNSPSGSPTAAIGDRVWIDADGDGVQDANEIGVEGVTVTLYNDQDGDGVYDNVVRTTTTDANGNYIFDGLTPDGYVVTVTQAGSPVDGFTQTGDPDEFGSLATAADNSTTTPIVVGPGDVFLNADFGYQPTTSYQLGDTIFFDADADGSYQSADGEYGIANVTVALIHDTNGDGTWQMFGPDGIPNNTDDEPIIATDITNGSGQYLFAGLPDNDYVVWVNDTQNVLSGLTQSSSPDNNTNNGQPCPICNDMNGVTISGGDNLNQDFGYTPTNHTSALGAIGDTIWFDSNNSGTATPDAGEPGIEGVIVSLTYGSGTVITTTTDENGHYYFGGLTLDETYTVTVETSNFSAGGILEGMESTYDPDNSTPPNNTGAPITLTAGSPINLDQDFSYYTDEAGTPGRIGNLIWLDLNADGIYDDASESPIANVTVDLYRDLNCNGYLDPGEGLFGQTSTVGTINAGTYQTDGVYLFSNLPVSGQGTNSGACFVVDVSDTNGVLAGYWHSLGTTGTDNHSQTDPYGNDGSGELELTSVNPSDLTADFGYYVLPAAVGNFVWLDDGDGIQESGEMGVNGITVTLTITYADGTNISLVTVTADAPNGGNPGYYSFGNLLLDEDYRLGSSSSTAAASQPAYSIAVTTPSGYQVTLSDVGSGGTPEMNDSDSHSGVIAIPTQGETNTSQNSDPTAETVPIASYDFGFDLETDFGDLPDSFDTVTGSNGATHPIISSLYLGNCVDGENEGVPDTQAGVDASGGDNNSSGIGPLGSCTGSDDEDGITFVTPLIPGEEACVLASSNVVSGTAVLNGWIDFNGDDDFDGDANEQLTFTTVGGSAVSTTNATVPNGSSSQQYCFTVPSDATFSGGETHMRFRLSTAGSLTWGGAAADGEVEDYYQPLACVGNLIWEDVGEDGQQHSGTDNGIDGVGVNLVWGGADGNMATTTDNITYTTSSAGGGLYSFCGLIPDDGSGNGGTYQLGIPTPPASNPIATVANVVDDRLDSDGTQSGGNGSAVTGPEFTISAPNYSSLTLFSLPTSENGISDNPGSYNSYPDSSDDISSDFGFITAPLHVNLASFQASCNMQAGQVVITWETIAELDNLGFNLYRSSSPAAPESKVNPTLIPSQVPGSAQGAYYQWEDNNIDTTSPYYYWLEDMDTEGTITRHGPVSTCGMSQIFLPVIQR